MDKAPEVELDCKQNIQTQGVIVFFSAWLFMTFEHPQYLTAQINPYIRRIT